MAVGKEIGAFEMKSTSISLAPGKGSYLTAEANFEGEAHGDLECMAIATMTVTSQNGKDGDYKVCARCFLKRRRSVGRRWAGENCDER